MLNQNFIRNTKLNKCKTLGIHYRGTNYKDAANHPFPPTYKQLVKKIDSLDVKNKFDKIFFSTEDKGMFDQIAKKYKNKIFFYNSFRSKKDDAFKKYCRPNHRFKLGEEILIESLILSKCNTFSVSKSFLSNKALKPKFLDSSNEKILDFSSIERT